MLSHVNPTHVLVTQDQLMLLLFFTVAAIASLIFGILFPEDDPS